MKLSKQEKAARRAAFQAMSPAKKAEYVFSYYKWPIFLGLLALLVLGSTLHRQLTKKEPALYLALANVSVGEELEKELTGGFLRAVGANEKKQEVYLYRDLYLSDDADTLNHEYAYASRMKLMGAVSARKLDLVLMNREAYDLLSNKGYLLDLPLLFAEYAPELAEQMRPYYTANEIVLADNSLDVTLGTAEKHEQVAKQSTNGLLISASPLFRSAGFDGEIYLGVLANSPRLDTVICYIEYLCS